MQPTFEAEGALGAWKMALQTRKKKRELIHHFNNGVQYCLWDYVDLIQEAGIKMSMCSSTESNENSIAEKDSTEPYNLENGFVSEEAVLKAIPKVIETYNNYRPHTSLEYKIPTQCHHSGRVEKSR